MPLDVLVMPLWKYLAGDYVTASERLAYESGRPDLYRRSTARPDAVPDQARAYVQHLRNDMIALWEQASRWRDAGEVAVSEMLPREAWHALRAFAANLEYPVQDFAFDMAAHRHPALTEIWANQKPTKYPHLIRHHDNAGFYLPFEFEAPFELEIWEGVDHLLTGSSVRLLNELNDLGTKLNLRHDLAQMRDAGQMLADGPMQLVQWGWMVMRYAARMSVQRRLPLIFDGSV